MEPAATLFTVRTSALLFVDELMVTVYPYESSVPTLIFDKVVSDETK